MRRTRREGGIAMISQIAGGTDTKTGRIVKTDVSLAYTQIDAKDLREPNANE